MIGDKVTIVKTIKLAEMKLIPLAGLSGVITKEYPDNKTPGAVVKLDKVYMGAKTWYVPFVSLRNAKQMEEYNKNDLINSMKL